MRAGGGDEERSIRKAKADESTVRRARDCPVDWTAPRTRVWRALEVDAVRSDVHWGTDYLITSPAASTGDHTRGAPSPQLVVRLAVVFMDARRDDATPRCSRFEGRSRYALAQINLVALAAKRSTAGSRHDGAMPTPALVEGPSAPTRRRISQSRTHSSRRVGS